MTFVSQSAPTFSQPMRAEPSGQDALELDAAEADSSGRDAPERDVPDSRGTEERFQARVEVPDSRGTKENHTAIKKKPMPTLKRKKQLSKNGRRTFIFLIKPKTYMTIKRPQQNRKAYL